MPKHSKYPGGKMNSTSLSLTGAMQATAARVSKYRKTENPTVADGAQFVLVAVEQLTLEQWTWLAESGDVATALADAVQQAMEQERAEAEADAMAPTYNGGLR